MKNGTLALAFVLALAGCDGESDPMNDAGPPGSDAGMVAPGSDAGMVPPGDDAGMVPPGSDAGPPVATGCPAALPEVPIQFGGCDALAACGGDPTGVWLYDAVCVEDPAPDLSAVCPQARVEDLMGNARGCVALDGSNVVRDVSGEYSWTVVVPESCTFGMGCAAIEAAIGVSCTAAGGDCRCPMSDTFGAAGSDTYTVNGSVLTTGDGGQYDFCVGPAGLAYEERGDVADEPGINRLVAR